MSCLNGRSWSDSPGNLKQLAQIGSTSAKVLYDAGIKDVYDLSQSSGQRIEFLLSRRPPFGNEIINEACRKFPIANLMVETMGGSKIVINCCLENRSKEKLQCGKFKVGHLLVVGSKSSIIFYEKIPLERLKSVDFEKTIDLDCLDNKATISFICESCSGVNRHVQICPIENKESMTEEDQKIPTSPLELSDDLFSNLSLPLTNPEITLKGQILADEGTDIMEFKRCESMKHHLDQSVTQNYMESSGGIQDCRDGGIKRKKVTLKNDLKTRKQISKALDQFKFKPVNHQVMPPSLMYTKLKLSSFSGQQPKQHEDQQQYDLFKSTNLIIFS